MWAQNFLVSENHKPILRKYIFWKNQKFQNFHQKNKILKIQIFDEKIFFETFILFLITSYPSISKNNKNIFFHIFFHENRNFQKNIFFSETWFFSNIFSKKYFLKIGLWFSDTKKFCARIFF